MLQGLSSFCEINRGGLQQLDYFPIHQIDLDASKQIISASGVWQFALSFSSGDWLSLPYLPREDIWQENSNSSLQGVSYQERIAVNSPGLRADASREIQAMERMRFILRLTDKNGRKWLIGSLKHGLSFRAGQSTGGTNGLNAYTFEFQGLQKHKAPSYAF